MVHVYISYAQEDELLAARLEADLRALELQGLVTRFASRSILPGSDRQQIIDQNFDSADVILLLVSPAYVRSEQCHDSDVKRAVERHRSGEAVVIPVIARPAYWKRAPFAGLQALPRNGRAVTRWTNRDAAWLDVIEGIVEAIEALEAKRRSGREVA